MLAENAMSSQCKSVLHPRAIALASTTAANLSVMDALHAVPDPLLRPGNGSVGSGTAPGSLLAAGVQAANNAAAASAPVGENVARGVLDSLPGLAQRVAASMATLSAGNSAAGRPDLRNAPPGLSILPDPLGTVQQAPLPNVPPMAQSVANAAAVTPSVETNEVAASAGEQYNSSAQAPGPQAVQTSQLMARDWPPRPAHGPPRRLAEGAAPEVSPLEQLVGPQTVLTLAGAASHAASDIGRRIGLPVDSAGIALESWQLLRLSPYCSQACY